MPSYHDPRLGKTRCGRCHSASWQVLSDCRECEQSCCDACATLEGRDTLLCSQCALQIALEREFELTAPEEMPELKPVTRKPIMPSIPEFTKGEVA